MRSLAALRALVILLTLPTAARAATLLQPAPSASDPGERGIAVRRMLTLDRSALTALRNQGRMRIDALPLGATRQADVNLVRVDPLGHARVEEVTSAGVRRVPRSDTAFFVGTTADDPASRVLVVAGRDRVQGFVVTGGQAYLFGPDASGRHRSYAFADVDAGVYPPRDTFCDNDLHAALVQGALRARQPNPVLPPKAAPPGAVPLRLDLAIETDTELRNKFVSAQATSDYVAALVAASTAIYERDLAVRLNATYVRIWSTTDPWSATATDGQLNELQAYWTNPANNMLAIAGPRALVHFVSGKPVTGGIAYIAAVCNLTYGFGVSQVDGAFNVSIPSQIWDVVVFTHELGHGVGSDHTHCYSPPLDRCYNQEPGCYSGPVVQSRGSIMSYCHLLPGGLGNIDLDFPTAVQNVVRGVVDTASCLEVDGPVTCGNGAPDPGEECDDGNTTGGDGCSPICNFEACGNGFVDVGEGCDDNNTDGGDGCSATCQDEVCGNGVEDVGEQCDDGNTLPGDGCTAACLVERCPIFVNHQENWAVTKLVVQPRSGSDARLALKARFSVPAGATVDPFAAGVRLLFEDVTRASVFDVTVPGGAPWTAKGARATYKDAGGAVGGVRKLTVRTKMKGDLIEVKFAASGVGGPYPSTLETMPREIFVLLGDDAAVATGACGQRHLGVASCRSLSGGKKLLCK
jgi:cysteine-rich repeat protein